MPVLVPNGLWLGVAPKPVVAGFGAPKRPPVLLPNPVFVLVLLVPNPPNPVLAAGVVVEAPKRLFPVVPVEPKGLLAVVPKPVFCVAPNPVLVVSRLRDSNAVVYAELIAESALMPGCVHMSYRVA